MTKSKSQVLKEKIEEVLRNRILDITDEYRGRSQKARKGISVYLGYPQLMINELAKLFESSLTQAVKEAREDERKKVELDYYKNLQECNALEKMLNDDPFFAKSVKDIKKSFDKEQKKWHKHEMTGLEKEMKK